jgi:hypothetical protein
MLSPITNADIEEAEDMEEELRQWVVAHWYQKKDPAKAAYALGVALARVFTMKPPLAREEGYAKFLDVVRTHVALFDRARQKEEAIMGQKEVP